MVSLRRSTVPTSTTNSTAQPKPSGFCDAEPAKAKATPYTLESCQMILVIYQHSGSKYVSKENATHADLVKWISRKTKGDDQWDIDWESPNVCELTHPNLASGYKAILRPDDWPINNGEPA